MILPDKNLIFLSIMKKTKCIRSINIYITIITIFVFCPNFINAQVSGISASKLATINAIPVTKNNIEFEPAVQFNYASKRYNELGKLVNIYPNNDSIDISSCLNFRSTYGVNERWEIGMMVPSDVSGFSLGTKYLIASFHNISMSGLAGLNTTTNSVICKINPEYDNAFKLAGGMAITWQLSDVFSIDMDNQFQKAMNTTKEKHQFDYFFNIDAGYFVNKYLQPVIAMNYYRSEFQESTLNSEIMIINLGITIEPAERFLMVINTPISVLGKNHSVINGFGFALTIMLN